MIIERVAFRTPSFENNLRVLILTQKDGVRRLPIWISPVEANDILLSLRGTSVHGPWPHELMTTIIDGLGAVIERVMICDYVDEILYAKVTIRSGDEVLDVDARPSDSLALAVRADAPIFVEEHVLERAGVDDLTEPFVSLVKNPDYRLASLWVSPR